MSATSPLVGKTMFLWDAMQTPEFRPGLLAHPRQGQGGSLVN